MWTSPRRRAVLLISLVLTIAAALPRAVCADEQSPSRQASGAYRVQPGDMLLISVWREQDLQAEVLVRPDGGLSFPLAGDIVASGKTVEELRTTLDSRIRKYIPDAVVTVAVKMIGGNRIYVIGKVNRPGEFAFSKPLDVMQALSLAGGTTSFASLNDIQILRWKDDRQIAIQFRYGDVEKGRALQQNIRLESGDTVVVP